MRKIILGAAIATALTAASVDAATFVASFEAGPVTDVYQPPYGADLGTTFTGSLRYDSDAGKLTMFTFGTPLKTFSLADVIFEEVKVGSFDVTYFFVAFNGGLISSNNTATVHKETPVYGFAYCNNCVRFTSSIAAVPEPGIWNLMILGFGAFGAMMRRHYAGKNVASLA